MKILKTLSKRGLALFLVLTMCVSLLPATAMAEEYVEATHTHNEDGWTCAEESELICGYEQEHTHDERCWETSEGALVCELEETEGHQHGEECYTEETTLTCGQEESEEHQHDESCYATEPVLSCGQEETEGHTHGEDCFGAGKKNLVCGLEEHEHSGECYKPVWTCVPPTADVTRFLQAVKAIPKEITAQNVEEAEARIAEAIAAHQPLGGSEKTNPSVVKAYDAILAAEIAVEAAKKGAQAPVLPEDAVVVDPADLVEYNDGSEEEALAVADLFTLVANTYLADEEDPNEVSFPTSLYFVGEDVDERFDFMDAMFAEEQETVALTRDAITWQDVPVTVYFFEKDAKTQDELLEQVGNDDVELLKEENTYKPGDVITQINGGGHAAQLTITDGAVHCSCDQKQGENGHGWLKVESDGTWTVVGWAKCREEVTFVPEKSGVYIHAFSQPTGQWAQWKGQSDPISFVNSENLDITKRADPATVTVGNTVTYTITIKNTGTAASGENNLTDSLVSTKAGITGIEGYDPVVIEGLTFLHVPAIQPGDTYTIKYSYQVTTADIGPLTNTVTTLDGKKEASATVTVTEESTDNQSSSLIVEFIDFETGQPVQVKLERNDGTSDVGFSTDPASPASEYTVNFTYKDVCAADLEMTPVDADYVPVGLYSNKLETSSAKGTKVLTAIKDITDKSGVWLLDNLMVERPTDKITVYLSKPYTVRYVVDAGATVPTDSNYYTTKAVPANGATEGNRKFVGYAAAQKYLTTVTLKDIPTGLNKQVWEDESGAGHQVPGSIDLTTADLSKLDTGTKDRVITLTAATTTATVTYHGNGGTANSQATVADSNATIGTYTVKSNDGEGGIGFIRDGYTFVHWLEGTETAAGTTSVAVGATKELSTAGLHLWAQWTETVPAITATKTDGRGDGPVKTYAEGETIHYTITIDKATGTAANNGLMKNFSITDKYLPDSYVASPANVTVKVDGQDATFAANGDPAIEASGSGETATKVLAFELATETTGTVKVEYDYTVTAADVADGKIVNKASIKAWFNEEKPDITPEEPVIETPTGSYKLSVTKVISSITGETKWDGTGTQPTTVKPGSTINYTITVSNSGTAEAKGVKLTDLLTLDGEEVTPALTLTSVDENGTKLTDGSALNPDSFTVPAGTLNADKTTVTPGKVYFTASYPVPAADVDGALDPDTVIKNSAEVKIIGKDDTVKPDNPPTIKVEKKAVSIVKTVTSPAADADGKYTVSAKGPIKYQIVVKNEGNVALENLKITDALKPQVTVEGNVTLGEALPNVAFTDVKIDGKAATNAYNQANGVFTIPALAVGKSCEITFKYEVTTANAGQTLVNVADVPDDSDVKRVPTDPEDPTPNENQSDPVTVGKLKIDSFTKELVTEDPKLQGVDLTGVTFGDPIVVENVAAGDTLTLLYKITVTGDVGAKFKVTDEDAGTTNAKVTHVYGPALNTERTIPTEGAKEGKNSVEIYVTKTFTADTDGKFTAIGNEATVTPGEGTDPIVPPSKSKAYTVTVNYVPVDANGNTLNNVKLSKDGTNELKSYILLVPVTCTPEKKDDGTYKQENGKFVYTETNSGYTLDKETVFPAGLKSLADADGKNYALLSVDGATAKDTIPGDVTITAKYSVDKKGGTPDNPSDEKPDSVQATVTYEVVNGVWTKDGIPLQGEEATKPQTLVVTLAEKKWTDNGMTWVPQSPHTLTDTEVPNGTPDTGFAAGVWSVDPQRDENGNVVTGEDGKSVPGNGTLGSDNKPATVTGDVIFILTHTRNQYSYTVEYYYDGAKKAAPTDATPGGNAILDSKVTLKPWNNPDAEDKGDGFPMRTGEKSEYVYDETRPAEVVISNDEDANVIKVYYLTDTKGGDNGGSDGIPDAYEAFVKYTLADSNKGQLTPAQNESLTKTYDLRETKDDKFVYVKDDQGEDTTEVELKTQITTTGATAVEKVSGQDYAFDYWTYPSVNGATIGDKAITGMTSGTADLGSETIDGVEGGDEFVYTAYYAEDKWKDADQTPETDDKDSETGGDGIPDKYQARITYVPKPDATAGTVDPVVQIFTSAKGTDGRYTDSWTMTDQAISSTATAKTGHTFAFWSWTPAAKLEESTVAFFSSTLSGATADFSAPTVENPTANEKTLYAIFLTDANNNQIPDAFEATVVFAAAEGGSVTSDPSGTITRTYDLRIPVKDSSGNVVAGQYKLNTDYSIKLKDSVQLGTDATPVATAVVIAKPATDYAFDKWELKQNGSETVLETILTKGPDTTGKVVEAELAATKTLGVTAGATYTYTAYFAEDVVDKEKPDVPGSDKIPDKYEVTFVFKAGEHGRRADGTPAKLVKVLTDENGSYVESGTSSIVLTDNVKAEAYPGYEFDKWTSTDWNPAVTCSSVQLTASDLAVEGDKTYTFNASFKSLAFTVVLVPNGGTWPENMGGYVKAEGGDTASKADFAANASIGTGYPAPKKTGNVFKGWKVNNLKDSSVYTEFPMPVVTMWKAVGSPENHTITLTAQWEPKQLTYTTHQHFINEAGKEVFTLNVDTDVHEAYDTPIDSLITGIAKDQAYQGQQYVYVAGKTTVNGTVLASEAKLTTDGTRIDLYYYLDTWKDGGDDPDSDSDKEPDGTPDVDQVLIRYTVDPANAGMLTTALQVETLPSDNKVTAKSTVTPEEDYNFASWSGRGIVGTSPQKPVLNHSFAAEGGHEYTFTARLQRKLTVNAADVTAYYDGQSHGLTVTVTGAEQYTVEYYKDAAHQQEIGSDPVNVADSGTIYFVVTAADGRYASGSATVTIKPVALTATAKEQTKVYDGEAFDAADLSSDWYTITAQDTKVIDEAAAEKAAEFIQSLTVNASITANCTDVGTYQAAIAFDGIKNQLNGNYTLAEAPADLVITPKPLYVTVTGKTGTVTYNGEEQKVTGYDVVVKDGAGEDAAEVAGIQFHDVTAEAKGTDAGTYAMGLKGTGFTLVSKNYTIAGISVTDGRLKIEPKEVTVTANNAAKAYGQADPTFTAEVNGTIGTDTVKYTLNRERGEAVGTYAITPAGEELQGNYKVSYVPGTLTISNSNVLTVTAGGVHVVYDGVQHTVTANASINGAAITVTYTDANGNVVAAPVNAGTYTAAITATLEGYETARASATVTIDPRPVTITVRDLRDQRYTGRAIGYTGTAHTTDLDDKITFTGLAAGDAITSVNLSGQRTAAGTYRGELTASNAVITRSGVNVTANYSVSYVAGTLSIIVPYDPVIPGGGGGTGGGGTTIPDGPTPLAPDPGTTIEDQEVPLAAPGLNNIDHFDYIKGYVIDGQILVRPEANITRAEVATIFFRLMTKEFREANWATENDFTDVKKGDWYNNAISTCTKAGILKGYEDGSFKPNQTISREEFAAIAARFASEEVPAGGMFKDIAGRWSEKDIERAAAMGWIRGSNGMFRPVDKITRAEVIVIVNRMLDRIPDADHMLPDMKTFPDNTPDMWWYADVQEATNSHEYDRAEDGVTGIWTSLLPEQDWAALEKEWATAADANVADVAPKLGGGAEKLEEETKVPETTGDGDGKAPETTGDGNGEN